MVNTHKARLQRDDKARHHRDDKSRHHRDEKARHQSNWRRSRYAARLAVWLGALTAWPGVAVAGPPFRTDDPVPVDPGHFEINLFSMGAEAASSWAGALPGLEVNYGALPDLQLHVQVAQGYTNATGAGLRSGAGDLELGTKCRVLSPGDADWFPQAALYPTVEVPVGNQHLGFNTGHAQIYVPLWLQKDSGAWTVYGGGGYWINPGKINGNYEFVGLALWQKMTERLNLGVEIFHQGAPAAGLRSGTGFNAGATYDFSQTWHLLASIGSGVQNRNSTNMISYYLALQLTF